MDINNDLSWTSAAGANGYKLTIGTSPTGWEILNNVDVGLVTTYNPSNSFPFNTIIFVKIVSYKFRWLQGDDTSIAYHLIPLYYEPTIYSSTCQIIM